MANFKIYDEDGNYVGELIEEAKESVSDSISSGDVNWAALLGLLLLLAFLWILSLVWAVLWPALKFVGRLLWWLMKLAGFATWWILQEVVYLMWWLIRLPFMAILYKEVPEWWFPDWEFPDW